MIISVSGRDDIEKQFRRWLGMCESRAVQARLSMLNIGATDFLGENLMRRRRKIGVAALIVASLLAFTVPFLFRHVQTSSTGGGGGGGGGKGSGSGSGGTGPGSTSPPANTTSPATNPVSWQGWHGICGQGIGKHLGILKKAAELGFNLTRIVC